MASMLSSFYYTDAVLRSHALSVFRPKRLCEVA